MYISKVCIWWIFRMWPQPWDQHTQNMSGPSVAPLMPHPRYWGLPALATKEKCFYVFKHYIIEIIKCVLPLYINICFKKEVLGAYKYFCSGMYVLFQVILIDSHWWAVSFSLMSREGWLWDEDEYSSVKGKLCLIWSSVWTGQLIRS